MTTFPRRRWWRLRRQLKAFGGALLIVGTTVLLLEVLLAAIDPWGLSYFNDVLKIGNQLFELDPVRRYVLRDGEHQFSYWSATIQDGVRVTPNTDTDADCTLVLLGDSVLFGHGVNDDQTWANHLAAAFPDVYFINTGMSTYNSDNVLGSKNAFPDADAYLYLLIDNDIEPTLNPDPEAFPGQNPTNMPFLVRYLSFILYGRKPESFTQEIPPLDSEKMQHFLSDMQAITSDERVQVISFDHYAIVDVLREEGYDIQPYTYPPYKISYVDIHLNPEGNRVFAEMLTPLIQEMVDEACGEK
ncbi:MAG: SGNH/GDSL hydrolase family protein [Chloroflexi bacterium]|nr:SGNH/GDSL hydrolase family protein [Chloroflexota bacterium]